MYGLDHYKAMVASQHPYDIVLLNACVPLEAYTTQRWLSAIMLTDDSLEKSIIYSSLLNNLPLNTTVKAYSHKVGQLDIIYQNTCMTSSVDPTLQTPNVNLIPITSLGS
jgi:hypothetical protein